ncbi:MAG: hypothetical protein EP329_28735 [Deltaproteobacteria bacterium]|nr:MAG: hypothetical protein EP329_28735 [Deltaproteobacteria bacterium]
MSALEYLLSFLTYALWFGPLVALVVWALWKLVHVSHEAATPQPMTVTSSRPSAAPPIAPLAHG